MPAKVAFEAKCVEVNLECLRKRFEKWLYSSFFMWDRLDDCVRRGGSFDSLGDGHAPSPVREGCVDLSKEMIEQLYRLLSANAQTRRGFNHEITKRYNHRYNGCPREIPEGCAYLVEQFGTSDNLQIAGNYDFVHVWDGGYPDTLGVSPEVAQRHTWGAHGFLNHLKHAGIAMRHVRLDCPNRSMWDSLKVETENNGYSTCVSSTLPIQHYDLPRDIFLAIAFLCHQR